MSDAATTPTSFDLDLIQSELVDRLTATVEDLDFGISEAAANGDTITAKRLETIRDLIRTSRAYARAAVPIVNKINGA